MIAARHQVSADGVGGFWGRVYEVAALVFLGLAVGSHGFSRDVGA
jgi:hypothetical protein